MIAKLQGSRRAVLSLRTKLFVLAFFLVVLLMAMGALLQTALNKNTRIMESQTATIQVLESAPAILVLGGLSIVVIALLLIIYNIFAPLSRLTQAMISASKDTQNAEAYALALNSNDETGKAAAALNLLLREVSSAIKKNKTVESQLRETGRYLKAITDNMIDGIVIADHEGRIESFSPGAEDILGYTPDEMLGTLFTDLGSGDTSHWPEIGELFKSKRGQNKSDVPHEVRLIHKNGHLVPVELLIGKTEYGGKQMNIITVRDISVRKQMENLLNQAQRMETIGRMSGGIAHDFNNMLIVISGNLELIRRRVEGNAELLEMIDDGLKSVDRGKELTQRILAFSRKQILKPGIFNINRKMPDIVELARRTIHNNIQIETRLAKELWPVSLDSSQLESALLNLIFNARDAIEAPDGRIVIETANVAFEDQKMAPCYGMKPGEYIAISITDNGCGIAPEDMDRVFDPFFSTKDVDKGTGLGLSMVYGFTRQSDGHTKITSKPGKGTTVTLYFPRSNEEQSTSERDTANDTEIQEGNNESVMVVEDRPDVLKYLTTTLRDMGYRVTPAKDGRSALNRIKKRKHLDLLITDVIMPGKMNGEQLATEVKKQLPGTAILYISGYTADALINQGALKKGVHLLKKPFTRRDLALHIRKALAERT